MQIASKKGYIYEIRCFATGEVYFGSTFNFSKRVAQHLQAKGDCASAQIIRRDNCLIKILLECYVADKHELRKIEQLFIDSNPCINKISAHRSTGGAYYEKNKDFINRRASCPCGSTVCVRMYARHEKSQKHQNFLKIR